MSEVSKISQGINLKLIRQVQKEKKGGKLVDRVDENGNAYWTRNDVFTLMRLLNRYDTTKHRAREWVYWPAIIRKCEQAGLEDKEEIKLSLSEAVFLKSFLKELEKVDEGSQPLSASEVETRSFVLEQLPD